LGRAGAGGAGRGSGGGFREAPSSDIASSVEPHLERWLSATELQPIVSRRIAGVEPSP